jgi:carbohydrate-selective porin OprB
MGSRAPAPIDFGLCRLLSALCAPALLHAQAPAAKPDTSPLSAHVGFTQFLQAPVSGGVGHHVDYGGRIDVDARVDTRLLHLWPGGALQARLATRYGESASGDAGALVPVNTALLDPAGSGTATGLITLAYEQMLPLGKKPGNLLVLGLGKFSTIDLATEVFMGGGGIRRFMNVSQIAPATEARNVPSVTNGATVAVVVGGQPVFSFAAFDPQPSQMTSGLGNLFGHGVTLVPGLTAPTRFLGRSGHQQLRGSWTSRRLTPFDQITRLILPVPDDTTGVKRVSGSWSFTWSADQFVFESPGPPRTGWGVFWQVGVADERTNPITRVVTVGVGGTGAFGSRKADDWGLAYSWTGLGGDFKDLFEPLVELRDELQAEAFYNLAMASWIRITADLQVIRPARPRVDAVILPGARLQLLF